MSVSESFTKFFGVLASYGRAAVSEINVIYPTPEELKHLEFRRIENEAEEIVVCKLREMRDEFFQLRASARRQNSLHP